MEKIFYVTIGNSLGMNAISLVEEAAVEKDFLCFAKEEPIKLELKDEAKRIISGVALLADTPIVRYSEDKGKYYIVFTKEVIKQIVEKYSKDGLINSVNLQHDDRTYQDGIYMIESYIKDTERGIDPKEFKDVKDGSWFVSFKVENDELWNNIVNKDLLNGFSIQGFFDLTTDRPDEESFEEFVKKYL